MTSPWYRVALAAHSNSERPMFDDDDMLASPRFAAAWERALANLGACLRDAGVIGAMFLVGYRYGYHTAAEELIGAEHDDGEDSEWRPGCGRPMPGWGE